MRTRYAVSRYLPAFVVLLGGCGAPGSPSIDNQGQIFLSPSPATVSPGGTVHLTVTVKDADGNLIPTPDGIRWSSSDEQVASLVGPGTVRGGTDGVATIVASWPGVEGVATVRVGSGTSRPACPGVPAVSGLRAEQERPCPLQ
jgi:hypothetical protein